MDNLAGKYLLSFNAMFFRVLQHYSSFALFRNLNIG